MGNGFWVKQHQGVLAICDEDVLGKKIGSTVISEAFYKGELIKKDKLKELMSKSCNINMFGAESVKTAFELDLANKKSVIYIGKIPHLQVVVI